MPKDKPLTLKYLDARIDHVTETAIQENREVRHILVEASQAHFAATRGLAEQAKKEFWILATAITVVGILALAALIW